MSVSEFHRDEIKKYLRFFRSKRLVQLREIENLFQDVCDARLNDDSQVLSAEEVSSIFQSLLESVKSNVNRDLDLTAKMSVVAIHQLFEEADAQDVELQMDTSRIEDATLIEAIDNIQLDGELTRQSFRSSKRMSTRSHNGPATMEDESIQQLQETCDTLKAENSSLRSSLAEIKEHAESLESALSAYEQSAESKGQSTAENDVLLAAELDEVKELLRRSHGIDFGDYTALVKSSKQFVQMRKTIGQKNDQLKQLRKRLMIYEPDDTEIPEEHTPEMRK